jgi:flagellar protein FliO/FliZ
MTQTLIPVAAFLVLLALLPLGVRWWQRRAQAGGSGPAAATKIVSAVAVGPQQRVVTVEVGPADARTWLVLGVTAQSITCLHSVAVGPAARPTPRTSVEHAPTSSSS